MAPATAAVNARVRGDRGRIGPAASQPNELDHRRILRAVGNRRRYRYVEPRVLPAENGYRIVSPNCSRNIDPDGGEIEVALIHFTAASRTWRLFYRDHEARRWCLAGEALQLAPLLAELAADDARRFWP